MVIWKHPGHLISIKNEFGLCTRRFSLCTRASSSGSGCRRSTGMVLVEYLTRLDQRGYFSTAESEKGNTIDVRRPSGYTDLLRQASNQHFRDDTAVVRTQLKGQLRVISVYADTVDAQCRVPARLHRLHAYHIELPVENTGHIFRVLCLRLRFLRR